LPADLCYNFRAMEKQIIIGLVGEKLAGKDTAANFLVQKYEAAHFRFTHILDAILEELNLPLSRRNEIDLGLSLRQVFGAHVLVNALQKRVTRAWEKFVVINGIRMDEMDVVKSWGAKIIYITADPKIRFQRFMQRREKADDGKMTYDQFLAQEKELTEIGIPDLGKKADFKIVNEGTVEELQGQMADILSRTAINP
jgi:dephospho-CoA kinase